jgi:hypothetical protein
MNINLTGAETDAANPADAALVAVTRQPIEFAYKLLTVLPDTVQYGPSAEIVRAPLPSPPDVRIKTPPPA